VVYYKETVKYSCWKQV